MAGELFKPINIGKPNTIPQITQPNITLKVTVPITKSVPENIFAQENIKLPELKENPEYFDVIKFLSENVGAEALARNPELKKYESLLKNLQSIFLQSFDEQMFSELEELPKPDKRKDDIVEWIQKQEHSRSTLFQIDDYKFVKEAITDENIDFVSKIVKFLKAQKDINPKDKYNIALAVILATNSDMELEDDIIQTINNPLISVPRKADFILGLEKNRKYSINDLKTDIKKEKAVNWIGNHIDNSGSSLEIKDIKQAERNLNENNIDFILELIKKMNKYIETHKIKRNSGSDLSKEKIELNNDNLIINAVNIVIAAAKTTTKVNKYNSIIEEVIESELPDEIKGRFILAIPNNLEFAKELLTTDKVEDKYKSDILEKVTNKNVNIIREIIEKGLISKEEIPYIVKAIKNDNLDYIREILGSNIEDCHKDAIVSSANKNTIKVIRKILAMDNMSDKTKAIIIEFINNSNFKQIYALVKEGKIPEEHIDSVIPYISKGNRYQSKRIINAPDLPVEYKGEFLANINNQNRDLAFEIIYDENILNDKKYEIIAAINKDNKKYAREIIRHEKINSENIKDILKLTNDETIDIVRKIINHPDITSTHMENIITNFLQNKENITEELLNKILDCKELKPCYKSFILPYIEKENTDLIKKILADKRIKGENKAFIIGHLSTNAQNKEWIEEMLKYDDFKFISAAIRLDYKAETIDKNFREEVLKMLELEDKRKIKRTFYNDNYEGVETEFAAPPSEKKVIKRDKTDAQTFINNDEISNEKLLVGKIKYYLEKFPNMDIVDICDLVNGYATKEFAKETGKLYTSKTSIVKHFSKNTSQETILEKTKQGDVIEQNNQLYINEGDKLFKWKMSKEKFDELFPAGERLLTKQGQIGDCFLVISLIAMMNNPLGKIYLYKSFEQKNDDIICTIRSYKDYGGSKKFPKGKLPKVDTRLSGCKGLQMLETTYNETAFRSSSEVRHKKGKFLTNLDRLDGGYSTECFINLIGAERVSTLDENRPEIFKHKTISLNSNVLMRSFLDKFVNNKYNLAIVAFSADNEKYGLMGEHTYQFLKYDKVNDDVILLNPHDATELIVLPYSEYLKMDGTLYLCNLEELKKSEE